MAGGVRVVAIYAKQLAERGHEVRLVSVPGIERRPPLWHRALGLRPKLLPPQPSHLDGIGIEHRVLAESRAILDSDVPDADVVIATWWETAEWVGAMHPSKGVKVYFVQHHEVWRNLPQDRTRATYRLPMHKIAVAQWLIDVMATEYGDENVDLVNNSVDHAQFFAPPRHKQSRPTIGFLYSPTHFKGVDVTIRAIRRLRELVPKLRVVSFGSSPLPDAISADIEFEFNPPQEEIRNLYAQCDVWVTASRSEGFNLPAMEAMACRVPVVSTRTGWPMESIVDGVNGQLVDVDDAAGLVDAILRILSLTDHKWCEMSEAAFKTVEQSSWVRATDEFERSLKRAIVRRDELAGSVAVQ
jgi:glycosyltransferase involved in cell wall biosynthesis